MNCFKKLIVCMLAATLAVTLLANPDSKGLRRQNQALIDSLRNTLKDARTPSDSIPILYNIFDLSAYADRVENAEALYRVAARAGNVKVQTDMCLHLANTAATIYNPELVDSVLIRIERLPDSQEKKIARCFAKASVASAKNFDTEKERSDEIRLMLRKISAEGDSGDTYDRIARMFSVITYMNGMSQGTLTSDLLDRLDQEISKLPYDKAISLRNKFYTTAAMAYSRNEEFQKAISAERKLLSIMDRMQADYERQGRIYRDFHIQRFVSYRRLMRAYQALNASEVEAIYDQVHELAEAHPDIARSVESYPLVEMAYLMKHKRYEEAIPLLIKLNASADNIYDKRYYLRRLSQAAEAVGNKEVLLDAAVEYSKILEEFTDLKSAERMSELQMIYDYQTLRQDNTNMELRRQRSTAIIFSVATVLLIIVVIIFIFIMTRLARSKKMLAAANETLTAEREELREATESLTKARDKARQADTEKTQLVNYVTNEVLNPINPIIEYSQMIIDNAQGENKVYLDRFKSIVGVNVRLLQGLVADVQELAMVESGKLPVNRVPVDLFALGQMIVDSVKPQVAQGVNINFTHGPGHKLVYSTDPRRVEIVLLNLLGNAAKFTAEGSINLNISHNATEQTVTFTVTDTGIGIPADKAKVIFNRFEKLNPDSEGSGLGLSVCAMVARALGADLYLDVDYPGPGARFVFTLYPPRQ